MRARLDWMAEYSPIPLTVLRKMRSPIIYRTAIGLAAAIILLFIFSRAISFGSVLHRLQHLNIAFALLCGVMFLGAYAVRALRWRYFLKPYTLSVRDAVLIYQVSTFINWLLPVRGGELVKAFLVRKRIGMPVSEALPTVAMDKLMDLLPSIVLLIILPFMPFHLGAALWGLLLIVAGVFLLSVVFLLVAVWKRALALGLLYRMFALTPKSVSKRVEPFVEGFVDALLRLAAQPRLLLIAAAYTVVAVSCDALSAWLAFLAIGAHVPFAVVLFGYTLYNLAFILPTPPGQIGSNEVIGLLVFSGIFGVSRLSVATMFVFSHPWTSLLMIVTGLLSLSALQVGLRSILALGGGSGGSGGHGANEALATDAQPKPADAVVTAIVGSAPEMTPTPEVIPTSEA
ncbi:MAG TPA: lysylphosphatidylglycerol synthase transmembrane domain-containing protein [Ktedonobacterales bacterium]|nr:lysylphosphatidylglycerol synthase transmembrane domain-containing protein [Ktedonobacterales bacterium]